MKANSPVEIPHKSKPSPKSMLSKSRIKPPVNNSKDESENSEDETDNRHHDNSSVDKTHNKSKVAHSRHLKTKSYKTKSKSQNFKSPVDKKENHPPLDNSFDLSYNTLATKSHKLVVLKKFCYLFLIATFIKTRFHYKIIYKSFTKMTFNNNGYEY